MTINIYDYLNVSKLNKTMSEADFESLLPKLTQLLFDYGFDKILKESDPESTIVSEDNEGFLGMDYKQIIMPLIKSIQELNIEIEKLKKELELLKQSK